MDKKSIGYELRAKSCFFLQCIPEDSGHLGCQPQALVCTGLVAAPWILSHSLPVGEADQAVHPTAAESGMPMTQGFMSQLEKTSHCRIGTASLH